MITLDRVRMRFQGKTALDGVSLDIEEGARVALVGPSGCGKSTLLRVVLGLATPDEGTVSVLGGPPTLETRQRIGYVVQDGGLFPHLSCAENVAFVAKTLGWTKARIDARLDELAGLVRLPRDLLARFPAQISGGQRQRIGIMRALMLDPPLLLLDEPMGALDPIVRAQLQEDLLRIAIDTKKTVLLVTHALAEAAFLAESLVVMNEGRIVQRGRFRELVQAPVDPFVTELVRAERTLPEAERA